ncbi:MAG: hydroxymethylbilane synthase, partial [Rhodanobacter sp.]
GGSCTMPVAAWCVLTEHGLHLRGMVGDATRGLLLHADAQADIQQGVALGQRVAADLLAQGARDMLSP